MKSRTFGSLFILTFAFAFLLAGNAVASPTKAPGARGLCAIAAAVAPRLPASLDTATRKTVRRVDRSLHEMADADAPKPVSDAIRILIRQLRAVVAASPTTRVTFVSQQSALYSQAFVVYNTYRSKYCPASTPAVGDLGLTGGASDTACLTDSATLRMAEDLYSTVNGGFTTLPALVSAGYLRTVSAYYSGVEIDSPPGGFTLIAVPSGPCANLPVAG